MTFLNFQSQYFDNSKNLNFELNIDDKTVLTNRLKLNNESPSF